MGFASNLQPNLLAAQSDNCDTGFQPVRAMFDFQLARFGSNNTSSTGRRPVSQ
jgi:hypothetical protein